MTLGLVRMIAKRSGFDARSTPATTSLPAGAAALQVSAGGEHSCAIDTLGRAFCWGEGGDGQLGNASTLDRSMPVSVSLPASVVAVQIDAGERHTCAVDMLGTVFCWGNGGNGRLGINTIFNRNTPAAVSLPAPAVQVSAGVAHSCALLTDGRVFCWGSPLSGRLGDGAVIFDQLTPIRSAGIFNAVQVSAGSDHTCARLFDGSALRDRCWGDNSNGELGDGTSVARATSVSVSTLCRTAGAFGPSAGDVSSCIIGVAGAEPGDAMCWGSNAFGQLGESTGTDRRAPTPVVAPGGGHACALTPSGAVQCWGNNLFGQLGDNTLFARTSPTLVADTATYSFVANGANHSCGTTAGQVKCWGANFNGQLGDGTLWGRLVPTPVTGLPGSAMFLDLGDSHSCAVVQSGADREVWCWGAGLHGQLGTGLPLDSWTPVRAGSISDAWVVSAGAQHTCATTISGGVYCWGQGLFGQVGNDLILDVWTPVEVLDPSGVPLSAPGAIVSAGEGHTCVAPVGAAQQAACWGNNLTGQLGNGSFLPSARAQMVSGIALVTWIGAGDDHTCARVNGGEAMCWGINSSGQLGDGTLVNRFTPVRIAGACY